jgi:uncharacterized membrane protein
MDPRDQFFVAHVFFLTALIFLVCAAVVVLIRQRKEGKPMVLAFLPLGLIFLTAYLGKHIPTAHQVVNIFYDGLLLYNTYYFWKAQQRLTFWFYILAVVSTVLDFAMHFAIRRM